MPVKSAEALEKERILKEIGDNAFFRIKEAQVRFLEEQNKNRLGGIHVTTWNKVCPRYIWYGIQPKPEGTVYTTDAEQDSHFYFGHLIHSTTDLKGITHETTMVYDFVNDTLIPVEDVRSGKFKITEDNKYDLLIGTNDDLIDIEKTNYGYVIVDKKTYNTENYSPRSPSEEYVLQINLYRILINKCLGIDASYGVVAYIDIATKGLKHIEFPFVLQDQEKTLEHLQNMRKALLKAKLSGELPPRVYSWLCDGYCPHYHRCMLNK